MRETGRALQRKNGSMPCGRLEGRGLHRDAGQMPIQSTRINEDTEAGSGDSPGSRRPQWQTLLVAAVGRAGPYGPTVSKFVSTGGAA